MRTRGTVSAFLRAGPMQIENVGELTDCDTYWCLV
jgi:hypothetical protein